VDDLVQKHKPWKAHLLHSCADAQSKIRSSIQRGRCHQMISTDG
jgi:hypothetical protein